MNATLAVILYYAAVVLLLWLLVSNVGRRARPRVPARLRVVLTGTLLGLTTTLVAPSFPVVPGLPTTTIASAAETLSAPAYVAPAVLPNGQVGMIFENDSGTGPEIRFKRYFAEQGLDDSQQLSTTAPKYPQLATFQGKVIAAYVDTRSPNVGKLIFRVSSDNGATWAAEYNPFGSETFDSGGWAPLLLTSRNGARLYLFSCCDGGSRAQYRYTTDPALATWTTLASAGDTTMRVASGNNCGNAGQECLRAHNFEFTELPSGSWVFIAKSDSGYAQSGRGTQVGTLGGAWSAQIDLGGSGGLSGGGESRATAFVDRAGNVYYVRAGGYGEDLYYQKSIDGGASWGPRVSAYPAGSIAQYTTGSPVGLYVPGYSRGEYVWYAGFGGVGLGNDQNAARAIPLWPATRAYVDTGTARLFGSAGGDWDFGTAYPYTFGYRDVPTSVGAYKTSAVDLSLPGRGLGFSFSRSYTSADTEPGVFGPGWTHNWVWSLVENGALVQIRRGDGRRDLFTAIGGGAYTNPPNVFDVLTKNGDSTFTLTAKDQTQHEFSTAGALTRIHDPAGNQILLTYLNGRLLSITDTVGRVTTLGYPAGHNLARGKTYTKSVVPYNGYIDTGNQTLTDGILGNTTTFRDPSWVAFCYLSGPLDVTVDLGSTQPIGLARSYQFDHPEDAIYLPASVEILTSTDNVTYTSQGSTTAGVQDSVDLWHYDLTTSASARYVRFRITAAGTCLMESEMEVYLAGFAPQESPVALSAGKPYTKSVAPNPSYPDTGGRELTDGTLASEANFYRPGWQGHDQLSVPLDVTIDLGASYGLDVTRSYHFDKPADWIYKPASVEILTSPDNVTYTSRGTALAAAAVNDSGYRWRYQVNLGGVLARYVRFRITKGGYYLLSAETHVFGVGAGPIDLPLPYGDRVIKLKDPLGRLLSYGYDTKGRLTSVVDKIGNAAGQDPTLHTWRYAYEGASAHITTVTDPDGRVRVTNTYDTQGRLATQKDGLNNQTTFSYGNGQTTITDARNHATTQLFDLRWRPTQQSDVVGSNTYTLQLFYDASGNLTASVDRNGNRTDYTYDTRGNVLTKTDPQINPQTPRFVTTYVYDAKNNVTQVTDPRGFVTTNTYDPTTNVRLSTSRQIVGSTYAVTKWEYGDAANPGMPTKIISPRGNTGGTPNYTYSQTLSYDSQGNLIQRIDADADKTTYGYDGAGRQTSMVDPDGNATGGVPADHTWSTTFDENDRATKSTDPLGRFSQTGYDGAGNRTSATDKNGNVTTYTVDNAARLLNVKQKPDPLGQPTLVSTTAIGRDANGNATSVTQANGVVTDYAYDAINRLASFTTHPVTGTNLVTSYVLDGNGNTTSRTAGDGVVTTYVYDNLNRLTSVAATGLATITYTYNETSLRTQMVDGTGTSTNQYDGLGRMTQAAQPNGTLTYGYDLDSNRTTLGYPTVGNVTYTYSPASRLTNVSDWASRLTTYTYTAAGLAKTVSLPNTMLTTYGYDRAQRLTSLVNAVGANTITSHAYTVDNEGNRTALAEFVSGITTPGGTDSFNMTYDGLNRLTAVTGPVAESFVLDQASNISSRTGPPATNTYDQANRQTADGTSAYTWSNADRLTNRGADTFGYDALDRLTSSTVAGTSRTYAYNGDGLMQSRLQGGTTTFLWDPSSSPSQLLQQSTDRVIYGLGPLYVVKGDASTLTLARDGLKSARAEVSASGAVTSAFRYRAYGGIAQSTAPTPSYLGYAGQLLDPSGLYYMRARWYDPASGRFISHDPVSGNPTLPASLNPFTYAIANPLLLSDPTGTCALLCGVIIGAVIGGVVSGASYAIQQAASGQAIDPGMLTGNVLMGAATGAAVGLIPFGWAAGFVRGALVGGIGGGLSDWATQVVSGNEFNTGELIGATVGGAAGGLVAGGALAPLGKVATKDVLTIASANTAGAQLAFAGTVSGWALDRTFRVKSGGGEMPLAY